MKKLMVIVFTCFFFFSFVIPVNASVKTYTRTPDNLLVSPGVVNNFNVDIILNTPAVDAGEKVYDFADLLSDSEEKKIYKRISKYIDNTNMDMVVVTISDNNKDSAMNYADDFYDYNDFGMDSSKSGVLFLVDMDNREIYISTTGKAISLYSDYRIDTILDGVYTNFSDRYYYSGIIKVVNAMDSYYEIGSPSDDDSHYELAGDGVVVRKIPYILVLGVPLFLSIVVTSIMVKKTKLVKKATSSKEYLEDDSVNIRTVRDTLVSSNTVATPIYDSSDFGGGGGGSSTHSGSSGSSHGGGGRGF